MRHDAIELNGNGEDGFILVDFFVTFQVIKDQYNQVQK